MTKRPCPFHQGAFPCPCQNQWPRPRSCSPSSSHCSSSKGSAGCPVILRRLTVEVLSLVAQAHSPLKSQHLASLTSRPQQPAIVFLRTIPVALLVGLLESDGLPRSWMILHTISLSEERPQSLADEGEVRAVLGEGQHVLAFSRSELGGF